MMATLVPTVTLARVDISKNAASPMLVIGSPLVISGMTTVPPGPVYWATFRVPSLLVVNVYCACASKDGASNRKINKCLAAQAIFDVCGFFMLPRCKWHFLFGFLPMTA